MHPTAPLADRFDVRFMPTTNEFLVMDRHRTRGMPVVLPTTAAVMRYVKGTLSDERVARGLSSLFETASTASLAA